MPTASFPFIPVFTLIWQKWNVINLYVFSLSSLIQLNNVQPLQSSAVPVH